MDMIIKLTNTSQNGDFLLHLGKNVNIDIRKTIFTSPGTAKIGDNTTIENYVKIFDGVKIGSNVYIGGGSILSPMTTVKNHVKIGKDCFIGYRCKIHNRAKLENRISILKDSIIRNNAIISAPLLYNLTIIGAFKKSFKSGNIAYYYDEYKDKIIIFNIVQEAESNAMPYDFYKNMGELYKYNKKILKRVEEYYGKRKKIE